MSLAFGMPGTVEMCIIGGLLFLIFGAKRVPQMARGLGSSFSSFKKGLLEGKKELKSLEHELQDVADTANSAAAELKDTVRSETRDLRRVGDAS